MSNEIGWDSDIKSGLQELLTRIGLIDSQCGRLIDEIDKSLAWNEEKPEIYSENDRVVFDGPLDEETCLTCLSIMKKGFITTISKFPFCYCNNWNFVKTQFVHGFPSC